jgi:hypothetical protein
VPSPVRARAASRVSSQVVGGSIPAFSSIGTLKNRAIVLTVGAIAYSVPSSIPRSAIDGVNPSVENPYCSSGARAPEAASCGRSGLSSMRMSGSVFEDPICRTLGMSWSPGTFSRL